MADVHQERAVETSRSMAEQNHGFRKFILDPKSSVMSYIADNMPAGHSAQHPAFPVLGLEQNANMNTQSQLYPPHLPPSSLTHTQAGMQWSGQLPTPNLQQAASTQPTVFPQMSNFQPYMASNLSSPNYHNVERPVAQSQLTSLVPQSSIEQDDSQATVQQGLSKPGNLHQTLQPDSNINHGLVSSSSVGNFGIESLSLMPKQSTSLSTARQYHRMILNYELVKSKFFGAKSRKI